MKAVTRDLSSRVEKLDADKPAIQAALEADFQNKTRVLGTLNEKFHDELMQFVGESIDKVEKDFKRQDERLDALEKVESAPTSTGNQQHRPEDESTRAAMHELQEKYESVSVTMNSVQQEHAGLLERFAQADETIRAAVQGYRDDLAKKTETLEHQITVLDSQFNNLSTKSMAEQIIGHMETIYPTAQHIKTDLASLNTSIMEIKNQLGDTDIQDLQRNIPRLDAEMSHLRENFETMKAQIFNLTGIKTYDEEQHPTKRRRVEPNPSGPVHSILTNGNNLNGG
ncbi:hypothetical protein B0T25DRAFT_521965 [Lasiosphaeria hispida]|uniref:Uncharacterized protein n=1 Tax=Lasiosphaeria hispida TaxID=260671 RepID=A0AAJ0M9D8_9PEZI|nr:hypothetical protein B0T25DRAFT_521965 [Lasiosphaeria hispida]